NLKDETKIAPGGEEESDGRRRNRKLDQRERSDSGEIYSGGEGEEKKK
ncbi:unnamed protein product, partial [Arabidopsis halleri]